MNNSQYFSAEHSKQRNEWKSANAEDVVSSKPIKMLYMQHNFHKNYHNASGLGDADVKRDILMSEIAKLIVYKPEEMSGMLKKYGIKISDKPTQRELTRQMAEGMYRSQNLAEEVSQEIAGGSKEFHGDGATATDTTKKDSVDYAALVGNAAELVKGIGTTFGGKKKAKSQKAATEAEIKRLKAEADLEKLKAMGALKKAVKGVSGGKDMESNIGMYIGIGLGVAAVVGFAIYWFKFRKK